MLGIESERTILLTHKKLTALLGVKDLIVVQTADVIFVSPDAHVGKIKEMLGAMNKNSGLQKFL